MARSTFGGGTSDYLFSTFQLAGRQLIDLDPGTLTFWSAETGGTQYTDLLLNGAAVSSIIVGSDGQIPTFQGPDGVLTLWGDAGSRRVRLVDFGAATAAAASINREASNGVAGLDAGGKLYETRIPTRLGDTALEAKYLRLGLTATTTVYVATTGNDSNSGLAVGTPFLTLQKAADYLATQGPVLQGQWYVNIAAGTYTPSDVFFKTRSVNPIVVRGPAVSGGVPTAIINGGGNAGAALVPGQQYVHGLRASGVGVQVEFRDIKAINYTAGLTDTTRIAFVGDPAAWVLFNNCHVVGATWTGAYAFNTVNSYVIGGIYDGCRSGFIANAASGDISGGTMFKNSTESGVYWSRGAQGHVDDAFFEDNAIGLVIDTNARADTVNNSFKRNSVGMQVRTGAQFIEGGTLNTYGTGADANTLNIDYKAFSGDSTELRTATTYARMAYDRTLRTSTGTVSTVTLATPYTIKANRLAGSGKQCRVSIKGSWTCTSGSALVVEFGGMTWTATSPAAGTNAVFVAEVELMDVAGGYRATGHIASGLNGVRMVTASSGFTSTSDQTITIKATMANTADTVNIHRTDVYLQG